jgi:ribosomal protein L7/L12
VLTALRCPECTAPVRELAKCAYCGAPLAHSTASPPAGRTEEHFAVVLRVGPSNVDRVALVLRDHLGVELAEALDRLARPPAEFAIGREDVRAYAVASDAKAAGAQAEVTSRHVAVPLRTVTLEDAGAKPLATIVALRAEIELSVAEAKDVVASTPVVIAINVEDEPARALVAALEAAGAKTTIR